MSIVTFFKIDFNKLAVSLIKEIFRGLNTFIVY